MCDECVDEFQRRPAAWGLNRPRIQLSEAGKQERHVGL